MPTFGMRVDTTVEHDRGLVLEGDHYFRRGLTVYVVVGVYEMEQLALYHLRNPCPRLWGEEGDIVNHLRLGQQERLKRPLVSLNSVWRVPGRN